MKFHHQAGVDLSSASRRWGARILLAGTVYNFGPDALGPDETTPRHPFTRKRAIRVEMERRLRQAADRGVPALVVRAGGFFGPGGATTGFRKRW
jgi:nucleoside-diphosphate-sugar epimerase